MVLAEGVLNEEALAALFSYIPPNSEVDDLGDQLYKMSRGESSCALFEERFPTKGRYGYSLRLDETLSSLRIGGSLVRIGHGSVDRITPHLCTMGEKYRQDLPPEELAQLEWLASKIKLREIP